MKTEPFLSSRPWPGEQARVLAMFCSDSRFVAATEEFLRKHLGL